jgi:hypothetical protein
MDSKEGANNKSPWIERWGYREDVLERNVSKVIKDCSRVRHLDFLDFGHQLGDHQHYGIEGESRNTKLSTAATLNKKSDIPLLPRCYL